MAMPAACEVRLGFGRLVGEHPSVTLLNFCFAVGATVKNGGTHFPYQNKTLNAVKGKLVIWPSDFTHPHVGVISNDEEKYIATGWFEIV